MKQFLQQNSIFLALCLILIAVLGVALVYIPKSDLHLLLCDRHTPALDCFYRYYTQVAEWFPYVVCVALLLFSRIGDGVFASSAMIFSALTTQLLKSIINAPRPLTWFEAEFPDITLPLVDGVSMNYWRSFPSGHTTSFFALAFVVVILFTRKPRTEKMPKTTSALFQVLLFAAATLGAYSRIYLSQHFAADVFAGIVVGVSITILCYAIFSRFENQKWYNYRLYTKK